MTSYFLDRSHPSHYWRWIKWSWVVAIGIGTPVLHTNIQDNLLIIILSIIGVPILAHIYGFLANLKNIRDWSEPGRTGPAVVMVCYVIAGALSAPFIGIELGFTLGFGAPLMSMMTFGIIFTGLTPLLGMLMVDRMFSPDINKRGFIFALFCMTASWLLAIMTGYVFGRI